MLDHLALLTPVIRPVRALFPADKSQTNPAVSLLPLTSFSPPAPQPVPPPQHASPFSFPFL